MLTAINSKIVLAILAALIAMAAHWPASGTRWKAADILEQQREQAEQQKNTMSRSGQRVRRDKKNHNSAAADEGRTWKKYIP